MKHNIEFKDFGIVGEKPESILRSLIKRLEKRIGSFSPDEGLSEAVG
jgi:hypothetical protein